MAVIEAKKTAVDPELGRHQAKLYADGLEKMHGHRPVIFYTNGFDIWIWDDAQGFPPRKLFGFYSKDSLQHLANYQRRERKALDTIEINDGIVNRLYQVEAIKRVSERCKRLVWLNPEGRMVWGWGDSEMPRYATFCSVARQCATAKQLERAITDIVAAYQ